MLQRIDRAFAKDEHLPATQRPDTPARMHSLVVLLICVFLLVGCGRYGAPSTDSSPTNQTSSTATPSPTASPSLSPSASAPETAVAAAVSTIYGPQHDACVVMNDYSACPVTSRLLTRLQQTPISRADPFCRCQNPYQNVSMSVVMNSDTTSTVRLILSWGETVSQRFDVFVVYTSGRWLIDDIQCSGAGTSTSLYAQNPGLCE